jgi:N-methylhydantoinase A
VARLADVRYQGQSFELTVDAGDLDGLAGRFHAEHERRYGHRMDDEPLELVNLRLVATVPGDKPELREPPARRKAVPGRRRAGFDGDWLEVDVWRRAELGAGSELEGPAVVELAESTVLLRPGWRGAVDEAGTLVLERRP